MKVWCVAGFLLLGCGGPSNAPSGAGASAVSADPAPLAVRKATQSGKYQLELRSDPPVPPMGELFTMVATVTDKDGEPLEDATVKMDARMPHHNHGMETDPIDDPGLCPEDGGRCQHAGGIYRTRGFKFHMGGAWTVTVSVEGPNGLDDTSFIYEMQ